VQPLVVVPVHSFEGRNLDVSEVFPGAAVADLLGLVEPDRRLREGIVVGVADTADGRVDADLVSRVVNAKDVYCLDSTGPRNSVW
jgi:hypothetical protein